jgi:tricorn protease
VGIGFDLEEEMSLRRLVVPIIVLMAIAGAARAVEPHAGMLRYPDVSATQIAFRYANDLWLVPREGGVATPLSSPPGGESFPRFSPDGETIAFMANYDGGTDLYTLPAAGGVPFRVTHNPSQEILVDWTPDGRLVFYTWGMGDHPRVAQLFEVPATGGLPKELPVPYGTDAVVSADGQWLAYTPHGNDWATWKRYMGGRASDIWLFNLKDHTSKRVTDWGGDDSIPMWHGDKLYYVSDKGSNHRMNIWVYDTTSGTMRQVTDHKDYDVKWPSIGPGDHGQGEIVYQLGPELRLLDLGTEKSRRVRVTIPGDRPRLRLQREDASDLIFSGGISSTGKRAVVGARGDVWTLPAEKGYAINLTRTDGVAERDPAWSPDGKWIAYFSDASGEYELMIAQSDGRGEQRQVTKLKPGYLFSPVWSPDSKKIAFWDQTGTLRVCDVESGDAKKVYQSPSGSWRSRVSWSSDGNWLALADGKTVREPSSIWLIDLGNEKTHQVTSGRFNDTWPTFDRDGKYLYFASERDFSQPVYDDIGENWSYPQTDRLFVVALQETTKSPLLPEIDSEEWSKDEAKGDEDKADKDDADKKKDKVDKDEGEKGGDEGEEEEEGPKPVTIDLDGFEARAILLPVEKGGFTNLAVSSDGKLFYQRNPGRGKPGSVYVADINADEDMEKSVLDGVTSFELSADGKKLLAAKEGGAMTIVDAAEGQSWDKMVSTSGMTAEIDPRDEWQQIFRDAWRIQRDFFYDPDMHGVDWDGVYKQYEPMVKDCASRADLSYVIGEMIGELNVGHAYYFGGSYEETPTVSVGLLGCDFDLGDGAYRISKIYQGAPWDADARGPLSEPGVDVHEGDYLLAVNEVPVDMSMDPWAAFLGLAGKTVTITVSDKPSIDDDARHAIVTLLGSDDDLRYRSWVEDRRAYVDAQTDGRVGYIYVPDTGVNGQNELVRQFYGQVGKDALIIDERWNGGGQVPTRFIELLNRPVTNYWAIRNCKEPVPEPGWANFGPKCMLINESAGSGGDHFPFGFRQAGLGKLIGTRTWGGLVGLSGNPGLIDGGYMSVPRFAFYNIDGTWGIEGHGVDPDIEVIDDPALMVGGGDPQLDAAIDLMKQEIKEHPYKPAPKPPYPDRSGMGVPEKDW